MISQMTTFIDITHETSVFPLQIDKNSNQRNITEHNGTELFQYSSTECIAWLAVFMTEAVAIVTLNIITIIIFMKNRSLRKRKMYLVINLAVADLFVGVFAEVMNFCPVGKGCNF